MQEKMKDIKRELIEKGKKKGVLTFKEISDAFEDIEVTPEEIERLYDVFEKESIELVEDLDKELEEIEVSKEELEDLSVPEGINIDDHVKMYLKEIGKVNNMILLDRKQSRSPNGLVFGTPGSGKSMSCKREITFIILTTKDNVIICDPEDEYSPLVKRLGK